MKQIIILLCISFAANVQAQKDLANFSIHFTINTDQKAEIRPGFPLILDISVSNPEARKMNQIASIFSTQIDTFPGHQKKKIDSVLAGYNLGTSSQPWYDELTVLCYPENNQDSLIELVYQVLYPFPASQIVLDGNAIERIALGVDPENTANLQSGKYKLEVVRLPNYSPAIMDTVRSNSVQLSIAAPAITTFEELSDKDKYFIFKYFLQRKRCVDARELMGKIDQDAYSFVTNRIMSAELEECDGRIREALHFYYEALENYNEETQYGPSEYLWDKIHSLQEQLLMEGKK